MKPALVLISILISFQLSAQNYGNVWQFGDGIGLDFTDCEPTVITGSNEGYEGCSSIADDQGQLLFYTNSEKVWNANHELMPNGFLAAVGYTLSQVIIIPKPLSDNIYYVVTTQVQAQGELTLRYHEVDMALDDGLGDVITANNTMTTLTVTEQIAATYHSNGTDIWLMAHEYGTNNFLAFLATQSGISPTPLVSSVGPAHGMDPSGISARGEIKFSPDATKLAFNANGVGQDDATNLLCLLDFDNSTGEVSNPINLPFSRGDFGLSFSPDNTKLYGTTWKVFAFTLGDKNYLYQFDISGGDSSSIASSRFLIDSLPLGASYGTLKIGPNGKIYVRSDASEYLGVINSPNLAGELCNYDPNGLPIGDAQPQYGLNNYIEYQTYCNTLSTDDRDANREKKLVRIIDLMGRESEDIPNKLLIHIYDDHTRKKVFRVEL